MASSWKKVRSGKLVLGAIMPIGGSVWAWKSTAKFSNKDSGVTGQGKEAAVDLVLRDAVGSSGSPAGYRRRYSVSVDA